MLSRFRSTLLILAVLLSGCATSNARQIETPQHQPVLTADSTAGEYPYPISNEPASKYLPYPPQPTLPILQEPYPYPQAPLPTSLAPYPQPAATQSATSTASWGPQSGDELLERSKTYIDSQQILVLESFPPQFVLALRGNLPTPCHKLRVEVSPPDVNHQILVEVYSLANPAEICIQVLEPFQANVPLKGLPSGKYKVLVNSEIAGEMSLP